MHATKKVKLFGWTPASQIEYEEELDNCIKDMNLTTDDVDTKCKKIEDMLLQMATRCQEVRSTVQDANQADHNKLNELTEKRKEARKRGYRLATTGLSKEIQKEERAI
jgi:uncharacterized protein YoxC